MVGTHRPYSTISSAQWDFPATYHCAHDKNASHNYQLVTLEDRFLSALARPPKASSNIFALTIVAGD